MTATAIGVRISAPSPTPMAMGARPKTVVKVVITMGRRRTLPACTMASRLETPSRRS